jgi:hypothetical protein
MSEILLEIERHREQMRRLEAMALLGIEKLPEPSATAIPLSPCTENPSETSAELSSQIKEASTPERRFTSSNTSSMSAMIASSRASRSLIDKSPTGVRLDNLAIATLTAASRSRSSFCAARRFRMYSRI